MASLAGLLKQRGFKVTGSDSGAYPPMSDFLASISIPDHAAIFRDKPKTSAGHGDRGQCDFARQS